MFDIVEDKRNIHAKPQKKTATAKLEFSNEEIAGAESRVDETTVVKAVLVKIW
jgi:hypothetical protein